MTVLGAALVACGDDGSGSGGGGGAGSGTEASGSTAGPGPSGSTVTGTGVVAASSGTQSGPVAVSSSSGGADCEGLSSFMDMFFTDPALNSCAQDACCAELAACGDPEAGDMSCFNADGEFDTSLPAAADLNNCVNGSGCLGAVICDSGISFGDDPSPETLEFTACLSENCCEEFTDCINFDETGDACIDCLNGDAENFDVCTEANDCALENCERGVIFVEVCDSGLGFSNPEAAACSNEFCCDDYAECIGDGSEEASQACLDCLIEGGGDLCDGVIECEETNCGTGICDTGIDVGNIEFATCLSAECCADFTTCVGDGSEDAVNACIDCYNEAIESGEPEALCEAAYACATTSCGDGAGGD